MIVASAERPGAPNRRTVVHWITVFLLSISGLLTVFTSIYFLTLPSGGYQGGRNPDYGKTFLFDRDIWTGIHTWAGIVMIAVALFHIALHWQWVVEMGRRSLAIIQGKRKPFNRKIWTRLGVISIIGLVFLGVAASGIYFFVLPEGRDSKFVQFLFSRSTWDLIHTWTGIVMIVAALVHLAQRWKWVVRVSQGIGRGLARCVFALQAEAS
jgi:hypothetical protein